MHQYMGVNGEYIQGLCDSCERTVKGVEPGGVMLERGDGRLFSVALLYQQFHSQSNE